MFSRLIRERSRAEEKSSEGKNVGSKRDQNPDNGTRCEANDVASMSFPRVFKVVRCSAVPDGPKPSGRPTFIKHAHTPHLLPFPQQNSFLSNQFFLVKSWNTRIECSFVISVSDTKVRVILCTFLGKSAADNHKTWNEHGAPAHFRPRGTRMFHARGRH